MGALLQQLVLLTIGLAVFGGAMAWGLRSQAERWRALAAAYPARAPGRSLGVRPIESVIATDAAGAWTGYHGVRIEVTEDGLHLRLFPLLAAFSPPLFLPFDEMKSRATRWYRNTSSFAITMDRAPGVDLIVSDDLMSWIREHAGDRLVG